MSNYVAFLLWLVLSLALAVLLGPCLVDWMIGLSIRWTRWQTRRLQEKQQQRREQR